MNLREVLKQKQFKNKELANEGIFDWFKKNDIDSSFIKHIENVLKLDSNSISYEIVKSVTAVEVSLHAMDAFMENITGKGQKKLAKEFFDKITNNQVPDLDKMLNMDNIIKMINSKINETPRIKLEEFKDIYNKKDLSHSGTQYMINFNGKTVEKMSDYYNVMKSFLTNFLNMYKNNIEKINNLPKCDYTSMFKVAFNVMCKGVGKMAELECLDSKFPNREKSVYKKDMLGTERLEVAREGLFEIIVFGPILAMLGIGGTMYAYEKGKELVKKLLNIKDKAEVLKIENIEGTYNPSKAILKLCKHLGSLKEVIKYIDTLGSLKGEQSSVKDMKNVTYYELSKYLKTKPIQNFKHIDFKLNNLKSELLENLSENLHYLLTDLADKNKLKNIGFEDLGNLDMKSKEGEDKLWDKVSELYTEISNSLNLKVKNQEPLFIVPCNDEVYTFVRATIDIEFKFNNKQWKTEVTLQTFTDCDDIDINDIKISDKDIESIKNCLNKNRENIEKLFHYNSVVYDGNICNKWFKDECFIGNEFITHITCFYDDYEPYYFESRILGKFIKDVYPNAKSIKVEKEHLSVKEFNQIVKYLDRQGISYDLNDLIFSSRRHDLIKENLGLASEGLDFNNIKKFISELISRLINKIKSNDKEVKYLKENNNSNVLENVKKIIKSNENKNNVSSLFDLVTEYSLLKYIIFSMTSFSTDIEPLTEENCKKIVKTYCFYDFRKLFEEIIDGDVSKFNHNNIKAEYLSNIRNIKTNFTDEEKEFFIIDIINRNFINTLIENSTFIKQISKHHMDKIKESIRDDVSNEIYICLKTYIKAFELLYDAIDKNLCEFAQIIKKSKEGKLV